MSMGLRWRSRACIFAVGAVLLVSKPRLSERYTCETMSVVPHRALTEPFRLVTLPQDLLQASCTVYKNIHIYITPFFEPDI